MDVNVCAYNGTSWGPVTEAYTNVGTIGDRPVDAAYEVNSGDALIVYFKSGTTTFGYRTWNGSTVSAESTFSIPLGGGSVSYATLYQRPGCDEMVLLCIHNGDHLSAINWNGSSWGSWTTLTTNLESNSTECYSMAFGWYSRQGIATYCDNNNATPYYRTW